jgi:hypothetical protein
MLGEKLKSGDLQDRLCAAEAILEIEPADQDLQSFLMDLIARHDYYELQAIDAFARIGPAAKAALPLLNQDIREAAADAIASIQSKDPHGAKPH